MGSPSTCTSFLGGACCRQLLLWKPALLWTPDLGLAPARHGKRMASAVFSLPRVTQGAFHLLFRTVGMKYRNTGWLPSTLPFPLTETSLGASYKAESLVSTFLYMDKLTDRCALVAHVSMLQGGRKWTCIKVVGPNLTSESPRKTGVNRDGGVVGRRAVRDPGSCGQRCRLRALSHS